jgi:neutral ceramidase
MLRHRSLSYLALAALLWLAMARLLPADVVEQGVKDSKPSGLMAGVAKVNIDPAVGTPHMNWGSATHLVGRAVDPVGMYMRALVLSDGKQKFALIDADSSPGNPTALQRASALTGIPVDHMRIGICHTHAGPALSRGKGPVGADLSAYEKMMESYRAVLVDKLVGLIVEANNRLRPVHAYGLAGTGSIAINRRFRGKGPNDPDMPPAVGLNFEEFTDRDLPVIRIDDSQGDPYAVLVNFQAHGTVLAYENQTLSADWPGAMRNTVEKNLPGATCIFFQGATGNQGPIEGFTGDLEVAHRLGSILGHEATALALRISTVRREPKFEGYTESTALQARQPYRVLGPQDATLRYASKVLDLPRRVYTPADIERMTNLTNAAERMLKEVNQKPGAAEWERSQAAARHRRWANLLERYKQAPNTRPVQLEVAVLRIGDMALLMTQGELFSEIGAAVKKSSPFRVTLFCGYGNRTGGGYMPTKAEYSRGSYEVDGTPYGPDAADIVVRESVALLKSVR